MFHNYFFVKLSFFLQSVCQNTNSMKKPYSYQYLLSITYPVILENVAQNILNLTDTAFMGRLGQLQLAAAAIGSLIYFVFIMVALGLAIGSQILIARRYGEQNIKLLYDSFHQTRYLMFFFSLAAVILSYFTIIPSLNFFVQDISVSEQVRCYLIYRSFGYFAAFQNFCFRAYYAGITRTRIIALTTIILTLTNIFFNYVLIFGHLGFPAMGIAGAAIASVIAEFSGLFTFFLTWKMIPFNRYASLWNMPGMKFLHFKHILSISYPLILMYVVSLICWLVFFLFIEKTGQKQLAVSNLVRSLYIFLAQPIWGFASITNSLVSQCIGAKQIDAIPEILRKNSILLIIIVSVLALLIMLFPTTFIRLLTSDNGLIQETIPVLQVILGAILILAISQIFFAFVTGTGNTKQSLFIETFSLTIYIVYAWIIIFKTNVTLSVIWTAEYVYAVIIMMLSVRYYRKFMLPKQQVRQIF